MEEEGGLKEPGGGGERIGVGGDGVGGIGLERFFFRIGGWGFPPFSSEMFYKGFLFSRSLSLVLLLLLLLMDTDDDYV